MFISKKKNPSGVISVYLIDKSQWIYKVIKTIGSSSAATEIDNLYLQGEKWIEAHCGNRDIFIESEREQEEK